MGAGQRGTVSRKFGPSTKLADKSMDAGAWQPKAGPSSAPSVRPIKNPPKPPSRNYAYKDGVGKTGEQ